MKKGNCPVLSTIFIKLTSKKAKKPYICGREMALFASVSTIEAKFVAKFIQVLWVIETPWQTLFHLQRQNVFRTLAQFRTTGHEGTVVFEMPNPLGFCSPFELSSQHSAFNTQTCQSGASSFVHCQSSQETYKKWSKMTKMLVFAENQERTYFFIFFAI